MNEIVEKNAVIAIASPIGYTIGAMAQGGFEMIGIPIVYAITFALFMFVDGVIFLARRKIHGPNA